MNYEISLLCFPHLMHVHVTYDQVRYDDLHDLGLQARPASEYPLEERDHDVAERCTDKCAVDCHFGHAAREVVAVLVAVLCNPRCKELL